MDVKVETWCDRDEHKLFEYYIDFNEWLDSDDATPARERFGVDDLSVPSALNVIKTGLLRTPKRKFALHQSTKLKCADGCQSEFKAANSRRL